MKRVLLLLTMLLPCLPLWGIPVTGTEGAGTPEPVSIIRLIADPSRYDGRRVVTRGYLHIEFEGNALYLSRTDAEMHSTLNALNIAIPRGKEEEFRKLHGSYASLEGTFRMFPGGGRLFSGQIIEISRVFLVAREGQQWRQEAPK